MEMPSRAGCKMPHGCGTHRSVAAGQPSLGAFEYRSTSTCCLGPSTRVSSSSRTLLAPAFCFLPSYFLSLVFFNLSHAHFLEHPSVLPAEVQQVSPLLWRFSLSTPITASLMRSYRHIDIIKWTSIYHYDLFHNI